MRQLAAPAIVLALGAAAPAAAQTLTVSPAVSQSVSQAALAPHGFAGPADPIGQFLDRRTFTAGGEAVHWRTDQVRLTPPGRRSVSSLRISVGGVQRGPAAAPLRADRASFDDGLYEVSLVRDWPGAVNLEAGKFKVDVSPHAAFGVGSAGGSAEAGAMVRVGGRVDDMVAQRLKAMGVSDGARFGDDGRWYLFAAASGRAVGMNMSRDDTGWSRQGWSTDPAATTIADAQVGVGWRRGDMQTSFGYLRREVKTDHKVWGQETKADSLVALSFSIRPGD